MTNRDAYGSSRLTSIAVAGRGCGLPGETLRDWQPRYSFANPLRGHQRRTAQPTRSSGDHVAGQPAGGRRSSPGNSDQAFGRGSFGVLLAVETPLPEIAAAARAHETDILELSSTIPAPRALAGLNELRAIVPAVAEIWAGGACAGLRRRPGVSVLRAQSAIGPAVTAWRAREDETNNPKLAPQTSSTSKANPSPFQGNQP